MNDVTSTTSITTRMLLLKWKWVLLMERVEAVSRDGREWERTTRKMSVLQATPELCSKLLRCQSIIRGATALLVGALQPRLRLTVAQLVHVLCGHNLCDYKDVAVEVENGSY